jgi:hypothetical protein
MACRSTVDENQMLVCELLWQGNEPKNRRTAVHSPTSEKVKLLRGIAEDEFPEHNIYTMRLRQTKMKR